MTRARDIAGGTIFTSADNTKLDGIATGATVGSQPTINVTVAAVGGSNKFHLDGTSQQTALMVSSGVYKFDQSDSSNANHPLRFSLTSDGTHGGGSAITTDFVAVGTAGQAGAYVTFTIQQDGADTYYYYCANHSGMGGAIAKNHHSGAGNQHVPAAGAAGQLLQYASAGTAAWASFSAGYEQVKFPSDWTSPSETFNSSSTYTKPASVADTDFIWIYLLGGGGAGCSSARANGSKAGNGIGYTGGSAGGSATLLYGQAKFFTGGVMAVGAAYPFSSRPANQFFYDPVTGNASTFTLTNSNGAIIYSSNNGDDSNVADVSSKVIQIEGAGSVSDDYLHSTVNSPTKFSLDTVTTSILSANAFVMGSIQSGNNVPTTQRTSVFAGGCAGARPYNYNNLPTVAQGTSVLAGAGGILNGTDGQFPGGAGRSVTGSGVGGDGAAGQIRIYHV